MNRIKVLFWAANPRDTNRLALDEEIRAITDKIRASAHRELMDLVPAWAVRSDDLLQSLNEHKPQIVHFSGHGRSKGEIILVDSDGLAKSVSKEALRSLFRVLGDSVRVVVLNACYSRAQAEVIAEVIDCVVGMNTTIGDQAAITFAASFYSAIGFNHSIQQAFEQGKAALQLEGIPEDLTPELVCRSGIDPSSIYPLSSTLSFPAQSGSTRKAIDAAHGYLLSITNQYRAWERVYTDLPVAIAPQIPTEFLPTLVDMCCFQVLIERSFGQEYHTIERIRASRIQDVVKNYSRIVLLGDPGCGKTVTIWRLALDYAKKAIEQLEYPWPVVIELGRYDGSVSLYDWILSYDRTVPSFLERLKSGSLLLLLDGLNEMPKTGYSESIAQLRRFLIDYRTCQFVVTCRRLDYNESLGLQQVEIEPLDKERIRLFISRYIKSEGSEHLYALLESEPKLLELAGNALNLKLIIALYAAVGDKFPRTRGRLIDGFIGALYERERNKPRATSIIEAELRTALGKLAFDIQTEIGKGTSVEKDWAVHHLRHCQLDSSILNILDLAINMGLLEVTQSSLRFQHQLIQEYFVALELDKHITDRQLSEYFWIPSLPKDVVAGHDGIREPLPPPPTTGWEEATIMLAGVKSDASELITQVADLNSILAARCISEGRAFVQPRVYKNVIERLLALIENQNIELNVRIQAGTLIGEFEDPRFEKQLTTEGHVLLPPLARILDGDCLMGSDRSEVSDSYLDEIPRHTVTLETFWIGKFPVTNAEFTCFINAGGYDSREYWTKEGWAWKLGQFDKSLKQWLLDGYRNVRIQVLKEVDRLEPSRAEDSEEMDLWWKILMKWSDERVEEELNRLFNERNCHPHEAPCYWDDPAFNGKTQPVITTWFEAQAYCRWLSQVTGKCYRLPTESEWEAATGGSSRTRPWGNDPHISNFNILLSNVSHTTPVGVYPAGVSIFGVYDLVGNVWEWTSSAKFPYPYRKDDRRETPFLPDSRRVVRGGSWAVSESSARNSCRGNFPPDNMVRNYIGFRVVCEEQ